MSMSSGKARPLCCGTLLVRSTTFFMHPQQSNSNSTPCLASRSKAIRRRERQRSRIKDGGAQHQCTLVRAKNTKLAGLEILKLPERPREQAPCNSVDESRRLEGLPPSSKHGTVAVGMPLQQTRLMQTRTHTHTHTAVLRQSRPCAISRDFLVCLSCFIICLFFFVFNCARQ